MRMSSMRMSVVVNAFLVHALIFNGVLSCKQRDHSEVKEKKTHKNKLFVDYLGEEMIKEHSEKLEKIDQKIAKEGAVLKALSREETVSRLKVLAKKIYLDHNLAEKWTDIPEGIRLDLSKDLVDFALLRIVVDLRKETEPQFATVVRDVYDATVGYKYSTQTVNGEVIVVDNPNYNKIPLERFDDSRSSILSIEDGAVMAALAALVFGMIGAYAIPQRIPGVLGGVGSASAITLSVLTAAVIIGGGQAIRKFEKSMEVFKGMAHYDTEW